MCRFDGKIVLVTGAASGIGRATAIEFVREGATLVATDIDKMTLDAALAGIIAQNSSVETLEQDVTDKGAWRALADGIVDRYGGLDVLFNNAGGGHFARVDDTTLEQWRYVNALNLDSVFFGMQEAIRIMGGRGGAIINNSSIAESLASHISPPMAPQKAECVRYPRPLQWIALAEACPFASTRYMRVLPIRRWSHEHWKALATRRKRSQRRQLAGCPWGALRNRRKSLERYYSLQATTHPI